MTGAHGGHGGGHEHALHGPRWLTISTAVVLGVAAILAGVTAWKSTVMEGHALENLTRSTQAVNDANALSQEAERNRTGERDLFIAYRLAVDEGDDGRAGSILGMMNATTRAAIDWWAAQPEADRPMSPFVSANPAWAAPGTVIEAETAIREADGLLVTAEHELEQAHNLEFVAALLTIAFLAGGLTGLFESTRARVGFLSVAVTTLVGCVAATAVFW